MKLVALIIGLQVLVSAQTFIPEPKDITTLFSKLHPGASISYKQVRSPCAKPIILYYV